MHFDAASKYFRSSFIDNMNNELDENNILNEKSNMRPSLSGGEKSASSTTISLKENDVLTINCTVNVSKPAANISIWMIPNHRMINDASTRKLNLFKHYSVSNADLTLRTVAVAKITVNRLDNHKSVTCIAENNALDEKWETKRTLNVLCKYKENKTLN